MSDERPPESELPHPYNPAAAMPFRPMANSLIRGTIILAMVCMVSVFAVQTTLMVKDNSRQFQRVVDDIAHTSVPLLSVGLWDIELKAVQQQVDLIAQRPQVGYVEVRTSIGRQFSAGDRALKDGPVSLRLKIPAPGTGASAGALGTLGTVGELVLVGNQQYLIDEVLRNALRVFVGYGIFTALICGLIAFMLRRELQIPLQRMAQFASELTPQTLTQPIELDRPRRASSDEIDLVADGFAKLQHGLRDHIANLDDKVEERTRQLKALAETNRVLSITDELTGCLNRRTLAPRLREEVERSQRYGRHLSVIALDLDFFKHINDGYGHATGDEVLRSVGSLLRASTRQNLDWLVRTGGEEFLIVLPETDLAPALAHAERLRERIETRPVMHAGREINITASLGVAQWHAPEDGQSLMLRADSHLYDAKEAGRNQVYPLLASDETVDVPLAAEYHI